MTHGHEFISLTRGMLKKKLYYGKNVLIFGDNNNELVLP